MAVTAPAIVAGDTVADIGGGDTVVIIPAAAPAAPTVATTPMRAATNVRPAAKSDARIMAAIAAENKKKWLNVKKEGDGVVRLATADCIRKRMMASPVTKSILGGKLGLDFGLSNAEARSAIESLIQNIYMNASFNLIEGSFIPSLEFNLFPRGTAIFGNDSSATYLSQGKFGGGAVSWLTWLLTKGTQIINSNYWVFYNPKGKTRSGGAVMQKTGKVGKPYRIEPGFSGIEGNNFVTRACGPCVLEAQEALGVWVFNNFRRL